MNQDFQQLDHHNEMMQFMSELIQNPLIHFDIMNEEHVQKLPQLYAQYKYYNEMIHAVRVAQKDIMENAIVENAIVENVEHEEEVVSEEEPLQMDIPMVEEEDDIDRRLDDLTGDEFDAVMALVELQELRDLQEVEDGNQHE